VLDSLRQSIETGKAVVSRANHRFTYPARFQLIAAMNPCRCGHIGDPSRACPRAPRCAQDYQSRLSGPLLDRFDLLIEVPPVSAADLSLPPPKEGSENVAERVAAARDRQLRRLATLGLEDGPRSNAETDGEVLETVAAPDEAGRSLLKTSAEQLRLTARGYHRVLRVARTIADLDDADTVRRCHVAEALAYRGPRLGG
jgi:magnesium chelatase family protein